MIRQEEIEALKELLNNSKEDNLRISRSFLEDIVDYFERQKMELPHNQNFMKRFMQVN